MDSRDSETDLRRENAELRQRIAELEAQEGDLRATEERYRVLYESNPTMYFTLDRDGTVLRVNRYGAAQLGYEPEELVGREVFEVFHEEERDIVRAQLAQCLAEPGKVVDWELRKLHRSGRVMWVREAARTVLDASSEPIVLVACSKIDDLKNVQQQLEEAQQQLERRVEKQTHTLREQHASLEQSERRYRSLVESQNELIVRWKPDGTRTFVNDAYCRYSGQTRSELLGTSFLPLVAVEDREKVLEKVGSLTLEQPWGLDVHRVIRADGSEGWNEWSDRAFFDDEGRLVELQSVGRDVTDRVRSSEELASSEERYRLLAENISDVIVTLDLDLSISYVSPSVRLLLDYEPEEIRDLRIEEMMTEDSAELASQVLAEELGATERSRDPLRSKILDLELRSRDGEVVFCETRASFLRDPDGSPKGILAVVRDITGWKKTQEALRRSERMLFQRHKLEAIGKLAGGLAHDFNNLLTVVFGNLDLLESELHLEGAPPVELDEIRTAANRGAALIRQLLAFGRRQVMSPELMELNELIASTVGMLPRLLGEDIEIVTELAPDLDPIRADAAQLEQVLVNLAVNARDAMPTGGRLMVATSRVEATEDAGGDEIGRWIELRVSDSGIGIPVEIRDRVFEPFFTTKEAGKGTGLGLASVYGIVQQSGGTVALTSEEGKGATFAIRLPEVDRETVEVASSPESPGPDPAADETVLVVEDEPGVRLLVRRTLEARGYAVVDAANGEEALAIARSQGEKIDLVLSDLVMPGMSGVRLAEELGASMPELKILFMTGHPPEALSRLGDLGPSPNPLCKPFTPSELLRRVRGALEAGSPWTGDDPLSPARD